MDNEGAGEFGNKHITDNVLSINTLIAKKAIPNSLLQNKAIDYFLHQRQDFFTSNSNITQQDRLLCLRQIRDGAINSGQYHALINQLPSPLSHINTQNSEQALENLYTQLQGNNSDHRQMRRIVALLTKGSLQHQDQVKKEDLKIFSQAQPSAIEYEQFFAEVIRDVNQANKREDREQKRQEYIESFDNLGNIFYGIQWQYLKQLRLLEAEAHTATLPDAVEEGQKSRRLNLIASTFAKLLPSKAFRPLTKKSFIRGGAVLALASAVLGGSIYESSKSSVEPVTAEQNNSQDKEKVVALPKVILKEAPSIEFGGSFGDVDSNSPTHWDKGTLYAFNSTKAGVTRYSGTDVSNLRDPEVVTFDKQISGSRWIEATYPHNGKLYGWYHQEQFDYNLPKKDQPLTIPRIGAIVSEDNGKTWKDLGFIVDTPPNSVNPDTINLYFAGGNGDFSVMPDQKGEYFYFFTTNYDKDVAQQGVAMARIKATDLNNPTDKVWKWHEGKWQEPGEGGKVTPIFPAKGDVHKPEANFFWGPSVHWNEHLQSYVMLMSHSTTASFNQTEHQKGDQAGVFVSFNSDISNPTGWSTPEFIKPGRSRDSWYPQIIGTGQNGTDKTAGKSARLFERGQSNFTLEFAKPVDQEVQPSSRFEALIQPFKDEALKRRTERAQTDPEYHKRIDQQLNEDRINFLLFGYGDTHEPPAADKAIIGSQTIFSIDLKSNKVDVVSLTHDIRAPEIEQYQKATGQKPVPTKIDQAYDIGGFNLMRNVVENATGFSADFQIALKDVAIKGVVDDVFNGLDVDVPFNVDTAPFWLEGNLYPEGSFSKGQQKMDGNKVLQFLKAIPRNYDPSVERNVRKHLLFKTLMSELSKSVKNPLFLGRAGIFLNKATSSQEITNDFNISNLLTSNLAGLVKAAVFSKSGESLMPQTDKAIYVVDGAVGDGGVQWVTSSPSSFSVSDRVREVYPNPHFEVPTGEANPYSKDLINDYWKPVRELIKKTLTKP